jgi:hypothetical protein
MKGNNWTTGSLRFIIDVEMRKSNSRIEHEGKTVKTMIAMYCHSNHRSAGLCTECSELEEYATKRLDNCPFRGGKTTCTRCRVHCYKPEMRERIRVVMRYSGPRMIYRHPVLAIFHTIDSRRKKPVKP